MMRQILIGKTRLALLRLTKGLIIFFGAPCTWIVFIWQILIGAHVHLFRRINSDGGQQHITKIKLCKRGKKSTWNGESLKFEKSFLEIKAVRTPYLIIHNTFFYILAIFLHKLGNKFQHAYVRIEIILRTRTDQINLSQGHFVFI